MRKAPGQVARFHNQRGEIKQGTDWRFPLQQASADVSPQQFHELINDHFSPQIIQFRNEAREPSPGEERGDVLETWGHSQTGEPSGSPESWAVGRYSE